MVKNFISKNNNKNKGQVMLLSSVSFLIISIIILFAMVEPALRQLKIASQNKQTKESLYLAEAGIEDVLYRIKNSMNVGVSNILTIDGNSVITDVLTGVGGEKNIISTGDKDGYIRKIETDLILGQGFSFHYGLQAGTGGIEMSNNATINGNVYSNGDIYGSNGAEITGSAYVSNFGIIDNMIIGSAGGEANANTVTNSNISGDLYCQSGSGNNKTCDTSLPDPIPQEFPVKNEDIDSWKDEAQIGGIEKGQWCQSG